MNALLRAFLILIITIIIIYLFEHFNGSIVSMRRPVPVEPHRERPLRRVAVDYSLFAFHYSLSILCRQLTELLWQQQGGHKDF